MPKFLKRFRRLITGEAKDIHSASVFHGLTLVAFLAWVGLGADGLSSSCYGPEKAFEALGSYDFLILPLAIAMVITIFTITATYCQVVELFPSGGGGYMVASRLLGPRSGLISGMALLIDYVLTISISCSHAADALLSFLPSDFISYKVAAVIVFVFIMIGLNLRGVKESIIFLMPIFLIFLFSHLFGIGWSLFDNHESIAPFIVDSSKKILEQGESFGWMSLLAPLIAAYAIGAGTYTGIEAVSNSMQILREPKAKTAKKTMIMMAISLAVMAVGLLFCYQFSGIHESVAEISQTGHHKTYNAILFELVSKDWSIGGMNLSQEFVYVAMISEALLLFVAAQAGFIGGPRMLATMAPDGWVPRWFSRLSDRLVIEHGVWFMGLGAVFFVLITGADVTTLVVMYSINVFITFFFSQWGMTVHWWRSRKLKKKWKGRISVSGLGTLLTTLILIIMCYENFDRGAWITVLITGGAIGVAVFVRNHYRRVQKMIRKLDRLVEVTHGHAKAPEKVDRVAPTAVVLVSGYNGMGLHALLNIFKLFPNYFHNYIFCSVSVYDFDNLSSSDEVQKIQEAQKNDLQLYIDFVNSFGHHGEMRLASGLDSVEELEKICKDVAREYPRSLIFGGQLVFPDENFWTLLLHRNASAVLQKKLHMAGIGVMILPVKLNA